MQWKIDLNNSTSKIKLIMKNNIIHLEKTDGSQASYNIPNKEENSCFDYLKAHQVIKKIGEYSINSSTNNVYIISDEYSLKLGNNINVLLSSTTSKNKKQKNLFIIQGENTKPQIRKSQFIEKKKSQFIRKNSIVEVNDIVEEYDFEWIDEFYNRTMIPGTIIISIHEESKVIELDYEISMKIDKEINEEKDLKIEKSNLTGQNVIFYGAPGTGKSHGIKKYIDEELKLTNILDDNFLRTTFHPEYGYSDFVGQIIPSINDDGDLEYKFEPGIFTQALQMAYQNSQIPIFLILEEMSRGNCASIFGDTFQLLDRNLVGESEYPINNKQVVDYLKKEQKNGNMNATWNKYQDKIYIPNNLYIIGTMNTSDQNVYVMDTAFKRRFDMEPVHTTIKDEDKGKNSFGISIEYNEKLYQIDWEDFVPILNEYILDRKEGLSLNEDKQLGQFFIKGKGDSLENNNKKFRNKVLYYLYHDVESAIYQTDKRLFMDDIYSFYDLYDRAKNDKQIFHNDFLKKLPFDKNKIDNKEIKNNQSSFGGSLVAEGEEGYKSKGSNNE